MPPPACSRLRRRSPRYARCPAPCRWSPAPRPARPVRPGWDRLRAWFRAFRARPLLRSQGSPRRRPPCLVRALPLHRRAPGRPPRTLRARPRQVLPAPAPLPRAATGRKALQRSRSPRMGPPARAGTRSARRRRRLNHHHPARRRRQRGRSQRAGRCRPPQHRPPQRLPPQPLPPRCLPHRVLPPPRLPPRARRGRLAPPHARRRPHPESLRQPAPHRLPRHLTPRPPSRLAHRSARRPPRPGEPPQPRVHRPPPISAEAPRWRPRRPAPRPPLVRQSA